MEVLDRVRKFISAPELGEWARATFIDEYGILSNPEHFHLRSPLATIGWLWTSVENADGWARKAATGGALVVTGKPWPKAQREQQLIDWFGELPAFLITVDARLWIDGSDRARCALIEHELLHCGQARDEFGTPKFDMDGNPTFATRPHDVEEFVSVVRRYGASVGAGRTMELVAAAREIPELDDDGIGLACGTCKARV